MSRLGMGRPIEESRFATPFQKRFKGSAHRLVFDDCSLRQRRIVGGQTKVIELFNRSIYLPSSIQFLMKPKSVIPEDAVDIPGYEGLYCADREGNVYAYDRIYPRKTVKAHKKKKTPRSDGRETVSLTNSEGKQNGFLVHRLVASAFLNLPLDRKNSDVDHVDGNPKNNCVSNLRIVPRSLNLANRRLPSSNTSGFKGVSQVKNSGKWGAYIKINGKLKYLGAFHTKEEAARTY
ncbi:MAG: HNH endonuclease, partial [Verrucomicrobiae bacterium]|nr:HNH endonuclease [Verrucomicrobiae bacterium]